MKRPDCDTPSPIATSKLVEDFAQSLATQVASSCVSVSAWVDPFASSRHDCLALSVAEVVGKRAPMSAEPAMGLPVCGRSPRYFHRLWLINSSEQGGRSRT